MRYFKKISSNVFLQIRKNFGNKYKILDHVPLPEIDEKNETLLFLPTIFNNNDSKSILNEKINHINSKISSKLIKTNKLDILPNFYTYIKENILSTEDPLLKSSSQHYFASEGKLIRPKMNLNLHKLLKENIINDSQITEKDELQTLWAAVIEIMHIASLIHDDILDNSKTRRGLITVHEAYSKKLATFAGNFLIGRAGRKLVSFNKIEIYQIYATIMDNLTAGEYIQAAKNRNFDDFYKLFTDYLVKSYYKTASLMAHSCRGVVILDQDLIKDKNNDLFKFENIAFQIGQHLGIGFQLVDDILDYVVSSEEFGKSSLNDLVEGHLTGPILFSLLDIQRQGKQQIFNEMSIKLKEKKIEKNDVLKFKNIIMEGTGIEKTRLLAALHVEKAIELIEKIGKSKELIELAFNVLERRK